MANELCILGGHIQPSTGCKVDMYDVDRIWMKSTLGDASFVDVGNTTEALFETFIDTEATWDTEIAKTDLNKLVGTGEVNGYDFPSNLGTVITAPDNTILGSTSQSRRLTFQLYVPTTEALQAYRSHDGKPVKFYFSLKGNHLMIKKYVDATSDVYFEAKNCSVGDMVKSAGDNKSYVEIALDVDSGALDAFHIFKLDNVDLSTK